MKLPLQIEKALEILSKNGYEGFVVGGSVRDMFMGKTPYDYDITTNALPSQTVKIFSSYKVIETGIKHGTVTVLIDGESIEITTYRVDGEYLDNRRPENVEFTTSLREDLSRRDFTMNAVAYNPEIGIVDPFSGIKDIKNSIIRCVGEPEKRFNEDGLRILRALRFSAQTGFEIEKETKKAIFDYKELIKNLSAERIFVEFKKTICGDFAGRVLKEYADIFGVFIPEILPMVAFEQKTKYHQFDVYSHTLNALENCPKDEVLRLAVYFHDIGKPGTHILDEKGISHFKGHAEKSGDYTDEILKRLKADNFTRKMVCELIRLHSEEISADEYTIKKLISQKGFDFAEMLLKLKKADASAKAEGYTTPKELFEAEKLIEKIKLNNEPVFLTDLKVSGKEIISLGIRGEKVGEILNELLDLVISGREENEKEKLILRAKEMIK